MSTSDWYASSNSNEWYTPEPIMDRVRATFGGAIDLDPASCELANRTVQAERYYDSGDDGLSRSWLARSVYLNPPGGVRNRVAENAVWWNKMIEEYLFGHFQHGVYCCFNLNLVQTVQSTDFKRHPMDFRVCFPRVRVHYNDSRGNPSTAAPGPSAFVCVSDNEFIQGAFEAAFCSLGYVTARRHI